MQSKKESRGITFTYHLVNIKRVCLPALNIDGSEFTYHLVNIKQK
ncbi:hypothetical protein QQA_1362 [Clostridioides difficile Y343]|nr:hypothetical protein QQA_1362 [Clostridioides difficile Y343]